MVQTTKPWHGYHLVTAAGSFPCFSTCGCSLFQREMSAILEIVEDVFVDQAFQMPPVENDHMVEQIPAAGAYPAFRNAMDHGNWCAWAECRNSSLFRSLHC
jgi:hypothetical protein